MVHKYRLPTLTHRYLAAAEAELRLERARDAGYGRVTVTPLAWEVIGKALQLTVTWALASKAEQASLDTVLSTDAGRRTFDNYRSIAQLPTDFVAAMVEE